MVLLLLPTLDFLVSFLATIPTLASKVRVIWLRLSFRFTVVFLAFAFLLAFPFLVLLTLSLRPICTQMLEFPHDNIFGSFQWYRCMRSTWPSSVPFDNYFHQTNGCP